jgi:hypothetical protein
LSPTRPSSSDRQVRDRARPRDGLSDEQPAGERLHRDMRHPARELANPLLDSRGASFFFETSADAKQQCHRHRPTAASGARGLEGEAFCRPVTPDLTPGVS